MKYQISSRWAGVLRQPTGLIAVSLFSFPPIVILIGFFFLLFIEYSFATANASTNRKHKLQITNTNHKIAQSTDAEHRAQGTDTV